jgi:hypothetical protein
MGSKANSSCGLRAPIRGVAFEAVEDVAARKLVMEWEHAASGIQPDYGIATRS